jgi:hypothetical protein
MCFPRSYHTCHPREKLNLP